MANCTKCARAKDALGAYCSDSDFHILTKLFTTREGLGKKKISKSIIINKSQTLGVTQNGSVQIFQIFGRICAITFCNVQRLDNGILLIVRIFETSNASRTDTNF